MSDPIKYVGEIEGFTTEPFIQAAEILVQADEPERALQLLNNLPGRYRDIIPKEIRDLKNDILKAIITTHGYMSADFDSNVPSPDAAKICIESFPRGMAVKHLFDELHKKSKHPTLIEIGPGEYWLPIGLHAMGYPFKYKDIGTIPRTAETARQWLPQSLFDLKETHDPYVFVAFELIEHLPNPLDLVTEALRHGGRLPDYVFLSTPLFCFDGKKKDWRKVNGQPHLRTYTPTEFLAAANNIFPDYHWEITYETVMILKGTRNDYLREENG